MYDHPDHTSLVWLPADGQPGAAPDLGKAMSGAAGALNKKTTTKRVPVKKEAAPKQAAARKTADSRHKAAPAKKAVATKKAASQSRRVAKGV